MPSPRPLALSDSEITTVMSAAAVLNVAAAAERKRKER